VRTKAILLADHHPDVLSFMESALAGSSYDVLTAGSSAAALNIVLNRPDLGLVISEDELPNSSGLQLLLSIKESFPAIAVMLTTADIAEPSDSSIPYLRKPFTAQLLISRVREVLENRAAWLLLLKSQLAKRAVGDALQQVDPMSQQTAGRPTDLRNVIKRPHKLPRRSRMQNKAHKPTMLLVENDAICRYAISHFLLKNGFDVIDASSDAEASELWRDHRNRIDISLIGLNGADGLTLAKVFEIDCPEKPIVFMAGADTTLPYPILQKPFELDDLLATVFQILDRHKDGVLV
jgi:DNA-binding response OmpR family regulator